MPRWHGRFHRARHMGRIARGAVAAIVVRQRATTKALYGHPDSRGGIGRWSSRCTRRIGLACRMAPCGPARVARTRPPGPGGCRGGCSRCAAFGTRWGAGVWKTPGANWSTQPAIAMANRGGRAKSLWRVPGAQSRRQAGAAPRELRLARRRHGLLAAAASAVLRERPELERARY